MLLGSFCGPDFTKSQKIQFFYQIICVCEKKVVPLRRKTKTTSLTNKNKLIN